MEENTEEIRNAILILNIELLIDFCRLENNFIYDINKWKM